jgi:TrmH family RNA methyltransferase
MERIASRHNPVVKRFRDAMQPGSEDLLLDGEHLLDEALDASLAIAIVAIREDLQGGPAGALAARAAGTGARVVAVPQKVLGAISPVQQPSGIVALARRECATLEAALADAPQLVIVLAGVQDPGNVGAIVRAADACGATGVIAAEGTADPFGWKALRGSMGSAFRVPVAVRHSLEAAIRAARGRGATVYAAVPHGGVPLPRCDLRPPLAILFGGEGAGVPDRLLALADRRLTIPMRAGVESLNVATAAALVAYEASRQRQHANNGPDQ